MKNVDLATLMKLLIKEDGLTEEEARAVAVATVKSRRSNQELQRATQDSVQQHPNRVDYGDETPAEAYERWVAQEMADPNGLFGGGASAGGVFGDAPIALDSFDPAAVRREVELRTMVDGVKTQREMLELLSEMRRELRGGNTQRQLPRPEGTFSRVLGRKKR